MWKDNNFFYRHKALFFGKILRLVISRRENLWIKITYLLTLTTLNNILPGASASRTTTPVAHSNIWQGFFYLLLPTDKKSPSSPTSADPRRSILLYSKDMAKLEQPLHYVYVIEEFLQLTVRSNAKIITNSHWTADLTYDFSLEYSQGCSMPRVHASTP